MAPVAARSIVPVNCSHCSMESVSLRSRAFLRSIFSTLSASLETSLISRFSMRASCWIVFGVRRSNLGIKSFLMSVEFLL